MLSSTAMIPVNGFSLHLPKHKLVVFRSSIFFNLPLRAPKSLLQAFKSSSYRTKVRSLQSDNSEKEDSGKSQEIQYDKRNLDEILKSESARVSVARAPFIAKLGMGLGLAMIVTLICVTLKGSCGLPIEEVKRLANASEGFSFNAFGNRFVIPGNAPGWVYFWLLMAAGCGLFVSEEALNIWVGITIARMLTLDGTWQSFATSFSRNAPYIMSTISWVYCGVCISDMIPFYFGKLFRQSGASDDICSKLGLAEEKARSITNAVEKYGNFSGFVERFSLGMRNPTAFLAGALGVSPECFFGGVCCGGLITLPLQLAIGFLLRERPMFAVATVATAMGIWTIFPYAAAASTAVFFYIRGLYSA